MSAVEIYGFNTIGEAVYVSDVGNAFRGAMHVWMRLSEAYGIEGGMFGGFQKLWKLADTGTLEDFENTVMKSTFDNVVVAKSEIPALIEAYRAYDIKYPGSNLLEQAVIFEHEILSDKDMTAVCWNQTDVNESPWIDGYDEEKEEAIPYNILTGRKHWFLSI